MECKNCKHPVTGNYCSNCGLQVDLPRISPRYIIDEIGSVLSFKKGILYSVKELLLRPGKSIRGFIREDRNRLVKPVIFLIFCSFVYTILQQFLGFQDGYVSTDGALPDSTNVKIINWIRSNYGYGNLIMSVFVTLCTKLFFWKKGFNFFEILILVFYVFGMGMLVFTFFGVAESVVKSDLLRIGGIVVFIYSSWAIGQFFGEKKIWNYVKALFAYILGFAAFTIASIVVGLIIDNIIK